ncbi:MAG: hypothetical protein R2706_10960 [Acidimicrobiales bacterium]
MLDHVFIDAIGSLRDALETALLERQALEERLHSDLLLGDVVWETSYAIPGEGNPPRAQADITLTWPTWAQSAYRSWYLEADTTDDPSIEIDVALRVQRLRSLPEPAQLMAVLPQPTPQLGSGRLVGTGPTLETGYTANLVVESHAVEISFSGSYELDESMLEDGAVLDQTFNALGGWVASALVRLGDLPLDFSEPTDS